MKEDIGKDFARALRRHHRERLRHARRFFWGRDRDLWAEAPGVLGAALRTPAVCSCEGCGNPRKWFGELTVQERRWEQRERGAFGGEDAGEPDEPTPGN